MSRNRVAKRSTWIDMTPFVDVAFLILTFFILATKFKPDEVVKVETPSSVSSKALEEKNDTFIIIMDKNKGVYAMLSENLRAPVIENMNTTRKLGLTPAELEEFKKSGAVATPISGLKSYYAEAPEKRGKLNKGIPIDSLGGELDIWIRDVNSLTQGKATWYLKGDNAAKYPEFKNVLKALKKNEIFKFNLVTATEPIPEGTALYKSQFSNKKK